LQPDLVPHEWLARIGATQQHLRAQTLQDELCSLEVARRALALLWRSEITFREFAAPPAANARH
jgi:hypothetical protein